MMFDDESEPKKTEIEPQLAIFTMTTFDYKIFSNDFKKSPRLYYNICN